MNKKYETAAVKAWSAEGGAIYPAERDPGCRGESGIKETVRSTVYNTLKEPEVTIARFNIW